MTTEIIQCSIKTSQTQELDSLHGSLTTVPEFLLSFSLANSPKKPHFMALTTIADPAAVRQDNRKNIFTTKGSNQVCTVLFRLKSNLILT